MSEIIGVVGWKNAGKTTLVADLVAEFTRRGFSVNTVKHAHHSFAIDREGTDSHTHRLAGAREVAIVSDERFALIHEAQSKAAAPSLQSVLKRMGRCDIVIVEGFKSADHPKIECLGFDETDDAPLHHRNKTILATYGNAKRGSATVPHFERGAISELADHIAENLRLDA